MRLNMELYDNWYEEKRSAYFYNKLAQYDTNVLHKKLFQDLERAAEVQASLWEAKIHAANPSAVLNFKPDFRTKIVIGLVKIVGTESMHYILSSMKIRGMSLFNSYHSEHKHTSLNSANNLRAAVFGMNDGLISNLSLILGVMGANPSPHYIILTGVAGLLAGACSMGAGEYISVRSQREVFEYQISVERKELEEYPEEEKQELSLIYQARGLPAVEAEKLAAVMINNPETGLDALAREELGLNPSDLVSPMGAMISSFVSFAIGAFIPLLPFFIWHHTTTILYSMGFTGIALFLIGVILSLFTNQNAIVSGLRMLIVGCLAGGLTYTIGSWLGAHV